MSKVVQVHTRPDLTPSDVDDFEQWSSQELEESTYLRAGEDIAIIEDGFAVIIEYDGMGNVISQRPYGPPPPSDLLPIRRRG